MKCLRKDTTFIRDIPKKTIFTEFDPDKMTQVFDNVITKCDEIF